MRNEHIYEFLKAYLEELNGKTLNELNPNYNELEQIAQYLFRQIAASIFHLHEHMKVIHRDIKPDNILFNSSTAEVKLTDFTCARGEIEANTKLFDSEGTPCFTAPECHVVE